jgi:hypothetical protein
MMSSKLRLNLRRIAGDYVFAVIRSGSSSGNFACARSFGDAGAPPSAVITKNRSFSKRHTALILG